MREEFDKLVAAGKLESKHVDALVQLTSSGYCFHRNWGFGKITTVDTVFSRFTIDFQDKPGHQMDLGFAAGSLEPIAPDHILARKAADLESVRQMAALNHLDLIKMVLQSYGGKATIDQIQQVLVPDVIEDDWKKWWEMAKKELKKSGHFLVPTRKSEPIVYNESEVSLKDRLLTGFQKSKGLKAKVVAATEAVKNFEDLEGEGQPLGAVLVEGLNAGIATHQRTQPAVALEAIFCRDEIRESAKLPATGEEIQDEQIWQQDLKLADILVQMPVAKHRRTLESFKKAFPERWHEEVLNSLNDLTFKLCQECISMLIHEGHFDLFKEMLHRLVNQHQASTDLLLWLAKERSDQFADILGPEVFRAMLSAMERDQFNERKSNKLHDYILDDKRLIVDLIGSADLDVVRDMTRALQFSPCFDDMDKRSLLARIVKSYPSIQSLISGEHVREDKSLIVSWESLERRRKEYHALVQKKIPANSKEIAVARSYGDLRENHEYKAAKEMQKLLMKRKAELESDLGRARGTDFANVNTDQVGIGTKVALSDLDANLPETFTILGAWDSDPDKGVISYLTPLAQALLNRKVGDEITFDPDPAHKRRFRIDAISAVTPSSFAKPEPPDEEEGSAAEAPAPEPASPEVVPEPEGAGGETASPSGSAP